MYVELYSKHCCYIETNLPQSSLWLVSVINIYIFMTGWFLNSLSFSLFLKGSSFTLHLSSLTNLWSITFYKIFNKFEWCSCIFIWALQMLRYTHFKSIVYWFYNAFIWLPTWIIQLNFFSEWSNISFLTQILISIQMLLQWKSQFLLELKNKTMPI